MSFMCDLDANDCNAPASWDDLGFVTIRQVSYYEMQRCGLPHGGDLSSLTIQPLSRSMFHSPLSILYKSRKNGLEKPILSNFAAKVHIEHRCGI